MILYELPSFDGRERRGRTRTELYAIVDIDRWTVTAHPNRPPNRGARQLLEKLRAEMDDELRDYLLGTFEAVRSAVAERYAAAVERDDRPFH